MIGRIERVPLREIWRHEAHDFTRWLQDNIDILNEALGMSLTGAEREQFAGTLNVDLGIRPAIPSLSDDNLPEYQL